MLQIVNTTLHAINACNNLEGGNIVQFIDERNIAYNVALHVSFNYNFRKIDFFLGKIN